MQNLIRSSNRALLPVLLLLLLVVPPLSAQECGDVDNNGTVNVPDVEAFWNYLLHGTPVPVDSAMLEFDGRSGITVGDLASLIDCAFWICSQFCYCETDLEYSYAQSSTDTIFFPRLSAIAAGTDSVALPVIATTPRSTCGFAANLPYLPHGHDWDSVFSAVNANFTLEDTALLISASTLFSGGRRIVDTLWYVREKPGPAAITPELLSSFNGKAMAVTQLDTIINWKHDLLYPVTMTYDVSLCCSDKVGNVDCDPEDQTDMGDLTVLIDHLFISLEPLCCPAEANIDGDVQGSVDMGDLTMLIDHLFISLKPLPLCLY